MSRCDRAGASHYSGCDCHEARWQKMYDAKAGELLAFRRAALLLAAECKMGRVWLADQRTHDGAVHATYGEYSPEYQEARAATNANPLARAAVNNEI
jgi:hypothetical protein